MWLYLCFLLVGCFCHRFADIPVTTVLQNTVAVLPCPHKKGNVEWSRYIGGERVILVTIENGEEKKTNKCYGSQADNSLLITNVQSTDSAMYMCNKSQIYLKVTTDPNMVGPNAGNAPVTPRNDGLGFGSVPGLRGEAAAEEADTEKQRSSDLWKVPVGVLVGAASVLLVFFTLRFCSKKKAGTNSNMVETVTEVIYEEIKDGEEQPRTESDVESPYYWASITETPSSLSPPNYNQYSTINKLKTGGRSYEECVYYFAQNPPQTGNI
ncbi:uncharacterized protein LOC119914931 [Micropterus salmoides]|uniref:uncharacterized protein LOC119914931 n=1 Tax=Micropterus salmoides TaxID=27706 RepID=UPI0018ECCA3A|nr:uncharacterized protein LOC119914931 [Micropterus salmoides]